MSKVSERKIKCEKCGEIFDVEAYDSINVTLDPELKEKIFDGSIYSFVCPHCGQEHYINYPILYHDMEHKFMIHQGSLIALMDLYDNELKETREKLEKDFPGVFDGTLHLGVDSYRELRSKIVMLEHGLDYKIATLYSLFMEQQYQQAINADKKLKEQKAHVCDSFFVEYEGKIVVIVDIDLNDENHTHKTPGDEIDMDLYKSLFEAYKSRTDEVFNFCFNRDIGYKLLATDDEVIDDYKESIMEVAIIDKADGEQLMTFVPEFNEGKYEVGDLVCVMKDLFIEKGEITRIFHMDRYSLPCDLNDMSVVAYKTSEIELTTTGGSNDELNNSELKTMFESYDKDGKFDEVLMMKSNVIVVSISIMEMADWLKEDCLDEYICVKENEEGNIEIPLSTMRTELIKYNYEEQDATVLCVYLEQKELTNEEASRLVYNLDDVIKIVLNNPDKYDGIIINPESDKIMIPNRRLVRYKYEKVMTNADKMRELLPSLKSEEISYIGKFNYDIICKVYNETTNPKKIAAELNKPLEEIDSALDNGYWRLKHIVMDNY